jgi:dihydrofolate reductase
MPKLRAHNFSISLDGYGAGAHQSREEPLGIGGEGLHDWLVATRTFKRMYGDDASGDTGLDDQFAMRGDENFGASIMGRNMFGPIRGDWGDEVWKGWWGDNPPYHHPVYVLTHHPHEPIPMAGGTTFYFVTDGIESAYSKAFESANGKDVRLLRGVSTIQQYMRAGLLDEFHFAISPVLLGQGERLFDNVSEGYECVELVSTPKAAHIRLARTATK